LRLNTHALKAFSIWYLFILDCGLKFVVISNRAISNIQRQM